MVRSTRPREGGEGRRVGKVVKVVDLGERGDDVTLGAEDG